MCRCGASHSVKHRPNNDEIATCREALGDPWRKGLRVAFSLLLRLQRQHVDRTTLCFRIGMRCAFRWTQLLAKQNISSAALLPTLSIKKKNHNSCSERSLRVSRSRVARSNATRLTSRCTSSSDVSFLSSLSRAPSDSSPAILAVIS